MNNELEALFYEELAKVIAAIDLDPPKKNKQNPHFGNDYADLEECKRAINAGIAKAESILRWNQVNDYASANVVQVITNLWITKDGKGFLWSEPTRMPIGKADAQGACGGFTYVKRYALTAIFNIVAEDDDDGEAGSKKAPPPKDDKKAQDKPPVLFNKANAEHKDKLVKVLEREKIADSYWDAIALSLQGKPMTELKNILAKLTGAKK